MMQKFFHGKITTEGIADALLINFNRTNYETQRITTKDSIVIQIRTRRNRTSGGNTALSVILQSIADGVSVSVGQQAWFGILASLGVSAITTLINPVQLINRLDDIAQDIESLQLNDSVWDFILNFAKSQGAGFEISEVLRSITCAYCLSANPFNNSNCIACGAPLGKQQPGTCLSCGFVVAKNVRKCPNCGNDI